MSFHTRCRGGVAGELGLLKEKARWRKGIKEAKETKVGKQMDEKFRIT